jgi:hypothetical protein
MNRIVYKHLEIESEEVERLYKKQIAFLADLKCFVYKNEEGELSFFQDSPILRKAFQESFIRSYQRNSYFRG